VSTFFRIHHLSLRTAKGTSEYEFAPGINVVSGSYGTGKSSMFELIKYGLGSSSAEIMPAIENNLIETTLEVTIGKTRIALSREFGQNRLLATFLRDGKRTEEWSATRIKAAPLASDRLLELLGVKLARLVRKGFGGSSVAISFFDLFRYMYLPQADVPRSIAGHADPFLNPKRKAVLEITYGLSDYSAAQNDIEAEDYRRELVLAEAQSYAIEGFLEASGAPERSELADLMKEARLKLADANSRLLAAREAARDRTQLDDQSEIRSRLIALRRAAADAEEETGAAQTAVDRNVSLLAQLELESGSIERANSAREVFRELDFIACPRCLQDLPVPGEEDLCTLCGQPEKHETTPTAHDEQRLSAQRAELESVLRDDQIRLEASLVALQILRQDLSVVVSDFELQLDPDLVLPSIDAVGTAAAEVERVRAHVRDYERYQDQWDLFLEGRAQVDQLEKKIADAVARAAESRAALQRNKYRVEALAERFDDEIRGLGFSDYRSAGLDEKTYLPLINGEPFERLSVAGARKVLANDAYYLAVLGNSLSDSSISLPGFVMIDGPRTSLGNTPEDQAAGDRLYYRFSILADSYPDAQIILADNGLPNTSAFGKERPNIINLSYASPLLQDVAHPGPGVPTVGQPTNE
jgi:hypothetical protein